MAKKPNLKSAVGTLNDAELIATWGWMQSTLPGTSPMAIEMTAELARRGLTSPSKPIDFSKMDFKPAKLKRIA
jgi:hypothetical protein